MAKRDVVAAIDIGTTKVLALVGEVHRSGDVSLTGVGSSPSRGLRKGMVVDIDATARAVQDAVQKARRMCGNPVKSAYLALAGAHMTSENSKGVIAVSNRGQEISVADVDRVLEAASVVNIPSDREIVHVLPRHYIIDGYDGIRDPIGMAGSRLEVEAHIVTGSSAGLQNLYRAVERAGIEIEDVVFAPLASGDAVLLQDEKDLGVVVADIGGGTVDIALYSEGSIAQSAILPMGGEIVTTDIAVVLRTSLAQAEVVKIDYGYACPDMVPDGLAFNVPNVGGQGIRDISAFNLAQIIEARMREIFSLIGETVSRWTSWHSIPAGVVLTGGVAATRGIERLAEDVLSVPVRVGIPEGMGSMQDMAGVPSFSTGVGMLYHAGRGLRSEYQRDSQPYQELTKRVKTFLRELF